MKERNNYSSSSTFRPSSSSPSSSFSYISSPFLLFTKPSTIIHHFICCNYSPNVTHANEFYRERWGNSKILTVYSYHHHRHHLRHRLCCLLLLLFFFLFLFNILCHKIISLLVVVSYSCCRLSSETKYIIMCMCV